MPIVHGRARVTTSHESVVRLEWSVGALAYGSRVDMDKIITLVISGLSLAVSVFVLWRQRQSQGRAHFTAEWESGESLAYVNHGPGAAQDVKVHLAAGVRPVDVSVPYIGAFQVMRIGGILRALAEEPAKELRVSWRDNRRRRQTATIHLPEPPQPTRRSFPARDSLEKSIRDIARDEAEREIEEQARRARRHFGW